MVGEYKKQTIPKTGPFFSFLKKANFFFADNKLKGNFAFFIFG